MKIIFLNTFEGKQHSEISEFFKIHSPDTDVFCLQEATDTLRDMLAEYLSEFGEVHDYRLGFKDETGIEEFAQATYTKKSLNVIATELVYRKLDPAGVGIATTIDCNGTLLNILNYHGISRPKDKLDSLKREEQSRILISHYENKPGVKILGGDFNFLPSTKSYKTFLDNEYQELIQKYNIPTTRNRLYWDNRPQKHLFSDYVFT